MYWLGIIVPEHFLTFLKSGQIHFLIFLDIPVTKILTFWFPSSILWNVRSLVRFFRIFLVAAKIGFVGHTLKSSICGHHTLVVDCDLFISPRSTRSFSVIRVEILSVKVPSFIVITLWLPESGIHGFFKILSVRSFFRSWSSLDQVFARGSE